MVVCLVETQNDIGVLLSSLGIPVDLGIALPGVDVAFRQQRSTLSGRGQRRAEQEGVCYLVVGSREKIEALAKNPQVRSLHYPGKGGWFPKGNWFPLRLVNKGKRVLMYTGTNSSHPDGTEVVWEERTEI